jgi:hypothetical protein
MPPFLIVRNLLVVALLALGLAACDRGSPSGVGAPCASPAGCGHGLVCEVGTCRALKGEGPTVTIARPGKMEVATATFDVLAVVSSAEPLEAVNLFEGEVLRSTLTRRTATAAPELPSYGGSVTVAASGTHELKVVATDTFGRTGQATVSIVVDRTPPSISILAPAEGSVVPDTVEVTLGPTDDIGIASVRAQVRREGSVVSELGQLTRPPWSFTWVASTFSPGPYELVATVIDVGGASATAVARLLRQGDVGDPCSQPAQCASGICTDGVCCAEICDGVCRTCAAPGARGRCVPVREHADPGTCDGLQICSVDGACGPRFPGLGAVRGCDEAQTALLLEAARQARAALTSRSQALLQCLADTVLWEAPPLLRAPVPYPEVLLFDLQQRRLRDLECLPPGASERPLGIRVNEGLERAAFETSLLEPEVDARELAARLIEELVHDAERSHPAPETPFGEAALATCRQAARCTREVLGLAAPAPPFGFSRASLAPEVTLAAVGTEPGQRWGSTTCPGRANATGLRIGAREVVDSLALVCSDVQAETVSSVSSILGKLDTAARLERCPPGELLVGLHGRAGLALDAVAPVCAPAAPWRAAEMVATSAGEPVGGFGGHVWRRACPPGAAVRALRVNTTEIVERLDVVCQALERPEPIEEVVMPALGTSAGGHEALTICAGRAAVHALALELSDTGRVARVGGRCRGLTRAPNGEPRPAPSPQDSYALPSRGGRSGTPGGSAVLDACPQAGLLVGLRGSFGPSGVLLGLRGLCAPDAIGWLAGSSVPLVETPARGASIGPTAKSVCPPGAAVVGWQVAHGDAVDAIRVNCRAL